MNTKTGTIIATALVIITIAAVVCVILQMTKMITPDNLPSILSALAWPSVALVFLVVFRKDIRGLIDRLQRAKLPGGTDLAFGNASIDKAHQRSFLEARTKSVVKAEQPRTDSIKWDNSGNLFWAGHDLMLLIDRLLRGFPKDDILNALQQSLHHIRELGFGEDDPIESKLNELLARAHRTPPKDWTRELRDYYATELDPLKGAVGDLASANQRGFDPGPKSSELKIRLHE